MNVIAILLLLAATKTAPAPDPEIPNIQATVYAMLNVISGPAGRRDWNRMKDLFVPGGLMISARKDGPNVMTPDQYIERVKPIFDQEGFFERPVVNKIEHYGNIAHVFCTYESRHNSNDAKPFARGINSFQLIKAGDDWKIMSILWQQEDETHPIPAAYLPK